MFWLLLSKGLMWGWRPPPAPLSSVSPSSTSSLTKSKRYATHSNHVTLGIVTTMACVGGVFYGEEDKGELSVQDQGL